MSGASATDSSQWRSGGRRTARPRSKRAADWHTIRADMGRRGVAWIVSFACAALGGLLAHALTYRLIDANAGHAGPLHSGHHHHGETAVSAAAGTSHWTLCVALCGSLGLVAVVAAALHHVGTGGSARLPLWLFGLVPPVGFALQEHLEWLIGPGSVPYAAALGASLAVGILLQIPFALAAYVAARALLALAGAIVHGLRIRPRFRLVPLAPSLHPSRARTRPRLSLLALGYGQRGPPLVAR